MKSLRVKFVTHFLRRFDELRKQLKDKTPSHLSTCGKSDNFKTKVLIVFWRRRFFLYNLLFLHSFEQFLVTAYFNIQIKMKNHSMTKLLFTQLAPQFRKVFETNKIGANQLKIEILDKLFQSPNGTIQNMLQELDLIFKHNLYLPS
jgi:hypothetical protein